ncbi:MAG: 50S ribosomal protein L23 [Weeksellaceae bacterium]|nr:50S ribosomal protein L23 [Weeksellaceae bacterium]
MSIILRPVITEKATLDAENNSRYSFYVSYTANKEQIKDAIEKMYGVSVLKVRTMRYVPTVKTKYTKKGFQVGKTNRLKKAIVAIEDGQEIDFYAN